jgi:hypothetical protein
LWSFKEITVHSIHVFLCVLLYLPYYPYNEFSVATVGHPGAIKSKKNNLRKI